MTANNLALGRNHSTADTVSMTDFGDCFRVDVSWLDGAHVYTLYDTKHEALAAVRLLGFVA